MVSGILKRLFPVLCCIVILISCMVVPASAVAPSVLPDSNKAYAYPFVNADLFYTVAQDYDADTLYGSSLGLAQFIDLLYQPTTANYTNVFAQSTTTSDAGPSSWIVSQHVYISDDIVNNLNYYRLHEVYSFRDSNNVSTEYFPWSCTFQFDDFGGSWNRTLLNKLFYLHGRYNFLVQPVVYTIGDNGELLSVRHEYTGTANGDQSVLFGSQLQAIEQKLGIQDGDPFVMSLRVTIPVGFEGQDLHISRLGSAVQYFTHSNSSDATSMFVDAPFHRTSDPVKPYWNALLTQRGLVTGEQECEHPDNPGSSGNVYIEGDDVTQFLGEAASSVLDAPIFGEFSLGSALTTIFIVAVVFWLLKVFAGG